MQVYGYDSIGSTSSREQRTAIQHVPCEDMNMPIFAMSFCAAGLEACRDIGLPDASRVVSCRLEELSVCTWLFCSIFAITRACVCVCVCVCVDVFLFEVAVLAGFKGYQKEKHNLGV